MGIILIVTFFLVFLIAIECEKNYYKILGVKKNAKEKEIKKAYHKMALKWYSCTI
jgi:preprotein translocase subunit Sec63